MKDGNGPLNTFLKSKIFIHLFIVSISLSYFLTTVKNVNLYLSINYVSTQYFTRVHYPGQRPVI